MSFFREQLARIIVPRKLNSSGECIICGKCLNRSRNCPVDSGRIGYQCHSQAGTGSKAGTNNCGEETVSGYNQLL